MPTLTEIFIQNTIFSASYNGTYSGSQGINNLSSIFTENNDSFIKTVALDTTVNVSTGYNTYYKMQGYNPLTQQYENWHSMGTPLLNPPSGNTLLNISIIGSWTDR